MFVEIACSLIAAIFVLSLFLLQADPAENEDATLDGSATNVGRTRWERIMAYRTAKKATKSPPFVSKELIMAMAQRKIYWLNGPKGQKGSNPCDEVGEDDRWTRDLITSACDKLDACRPAVMSMEQIVKNFCERIEKIIDAYQEKLDDYSNMLALITQARISIDEEVYQKSMDECKNEQEYATTAPDDCRHHWKLLAPPSTSCPVISSSSNDDCLSIYDQFVNENLITRTFANK